MAELAAVLALTPPPRPNQTPAQRFEMVSAPGNDSTKATPTSRPEQSVVTRSHQLVAGFLASQGYTDTLAAFNREAAAALDGVELLTPTEASTDLRDVVADYLTSRMHALAIPAPPLEDELLRLKLESPLPTKITKVIRDGTNVLTVRRGVLPRRAWEGTSGRFKRYVGASTGLML
mgnify:FL=1